MQLSRTKIGAFVLALVFLQAVPLACFSFDCPAQMSATDHTCCVSAKSMSSSFAESQPDCCRLHLDKPDGTIQASSDVSSISALAVVAVLDGIIDASPLSLDFALSVPIPPRTDPSFVSPLRI